MVGRSGASGTSAFGAESRLAPAWIADRACRPPGPSVIPLAGSVPGPVPQASLEPGPEPSEAAEAECH